MHIHKEVLIDKQREILPLLNIFSKNFYLVGGTAIALQIGHRRSVDFDLFTNSDKVKPRSIKFKIKKNNYLIDKIVHEASDQMHLIINSIKITFYCYPHEIKKLIDFEDIIKMPDLLTLSAMKAYALGGRAKWKD